MWRWALGSLAYFVGPCGSVRAGLQELVSGAWTVVLVDGLPFVGIMWAAELSEACAAFLCWLAILLLCSAAALSVWVAGLGMVTFLVILVNACLTWSVLCRRICTCCASRLDDNPGSASAGFLGCEGLAMMELIVGPLGGFSHLPSRRLFVGAWVTGRLLDALDDARCETTFVVYYVTYVTRNPVKLTGLKRSYYFRDNVRRQSTTISGETPVQVDRT